MTTNNNNYINTNPNQPPFQQPQHFQIESDLESWQQFIPKDAVAGMYDTNTKNDYAYTDNNNNKMNGLLDRDETGKKDKYMQGEKNLSCCPNLSLRQRLVGCAVCYGISFLLSYLSYDFLSSIVRGKVDRFAIPYSMSTIFTILASLFLFNPRNSFGRMVEKKRILITFCYFASIFMTLFCALYLKQQHLTFLFLII